MIHQYLAFLAQLEQHNNRTWFTENKKQYQALRAEYIAWIEEILFEMMDFDNSLQFLTGKDCVFRINRDIRFTNDKSPYKTNLSGIFSASGKSGHNSGYYFEISTNNKLMVGGGQYYLFPKDLFKVRQMLSEDATLLREVLKHKKFKKMFGSLTGDQLKTHPKGFSAEDENIDLLKFKNYLALTTLNISDVSDKEIKEVILSHFKVVKPLVDLLRKW